MKRPDFEDYRNMFISCMSEIIGVKQAELPGMPWREIGPEHAKLVLEAVMDSLRDQYGIEFEINHRLISVEGSVESAIIQSFHELNTICLMERIYAKIRGKLN